MEFNIINIFYSQVIFFTIMLILHHENHILINIAIFNILILSIWNYIKDESIYLAQLLILKMKELILNIINEYKKEPHQSLHQLFQKYDINLKKLTIEEIISNSSKKENENENE